MKYSLRSLMGWIIGPVVWGSSLSFMVYGLWTGAWYGYVFLAIFVVGGFVLSASVYYSINATTPSNEAWLARIREAQKEIDENRFFGE